MHQTCLSTLAVFMPETLKSSRDDFNVLDNFNVSSIKMAIVFVHEASKAWSYRYSQIILRDPF